VQSAWGNLWQFPFKTATNGGAAFVVFYLLAVALVGFPAMLAEFVLGRRTHVNAVDAFASLGHRQWRVAGGPAVVLIVALSSAISLLEVTVAYANDNYGLKRRYLAPAIGLVLFALGLPSALDTAWLTWFDSLAYQLLLPLSVLVTIVFVGWMIGTEAVEELRTGAGGLDALGPAWLWTLRLVVAAAIPLTLGLGVNELFLVEGGAFFQPF